MHHNTPAIEEGVSAIQHLFIMLILFSLSFALIETNGAVQFVYLNNPRQVYTNNHGKFRTTLRFHRTIKYTNINNILFINEPN